ncbi:hypothetical protein EHP00_375 [Ecytonucleospora hepatopenaei]|uniref:Uncharacterized protein n=1 Tax=Ecytonucleospora hepatopenaei TaxID=646526 RepID=A0A1W0E9C8_9MICR|nr:hypothetical protein EHP00_375 [Ecytonucleospora hepatopenaei]
MYEKLTAFLLSNKGIFNDEEFYNFMYLLADAYGVKQEYCVFEKYGLVESMLDNNEKTSFKKDILKSHMSRSLKDSLREDVVTDFREKNKKLYNNKLQTSNLDGEALNKNTMNSNFLDVKNKISSECIASNSKKFKKKGNLSISNVFEENFEEEKFRQDVFKNLLNSNHIDKDFITEKECKNPYKKDFNIFIKETNDDKNDREFCFDLGNIDVVEFQEGPEYLFYL